MDTLLTLAILKCIFLISIFSYIFTKLKRPKRQDSQAKLANATAVTVIDEPQKMRLNGSPNSHFKMAKTSSTTNQHMQQQQNDSNTSSSSSASSSASSTVCRIEQQNPLAMNNSSTSSVCATPNELLFHHPIQMLSQPHSQNPVPPISLGSLHYGPFGLPSFASSQGHSLIHFPYQFQQQQAIEKPATANLAATVALQMGGLNTGGLLAIQNAYEGLPIFVAPHSGALSLNALQRAAEFKAMALNALLQQQNQQQQIQPNKPDTSKHFHVFVGDLSQDVDNEMLKEAFKKYGEVSEAKVMRDPQSSKSRSFGFVAFPQKEDAQLAIDGMNGTMLGRRPIRTGWAVKRNSVGTNGGQNGASEDERVNPSTLFESIYNATDADNTTVYLGGLSNMATDEPIHAIFAQFGTIKEIRMFAAQNFGFVVFGDKAQATRAIMEMHGKELDLGIVAGKCKLRVKWGKPIQHGSANGIITGIKATNSGNGNNNDGNATNTDFQSPALVALSQNSARLAQQQQNHQLAAAAAMAVQAQTQSTGHQPMLIPPMGGQQLLHTAHHFAQPQIGTGPFCAATASWPQQT